MNIPVAPLSKGALTVMPSCVSTFSIPMLSHTSLNILNVLLTSLWLSSSFSAPFGTPVHVPLCCAFASMDYATSPQFHHCFFCSVLYSGHRIFLLSCLYPILYLKKYHQGNKKTFHIYFSFNKKMPWIIFQLRFCTCTWIATRPLVRKVSRKLLDGISCAEDEGGRI